MSEEIKNEEEKKCCCVCKFFKTEAFQKFLIVALGTFLGMFCAMSLFFALHKPPMMHHGHHFRDGGANMERPMGQHHFKEHKNFDKGEFMPKPNFDKPMPADAPKPETAE